MKTISKKVLLMFLALMPIASISFAAQSVLAVAQAQGADGGDAPNPTVSWTNGN
jgi:hypothetical protein